MLYVNHRLLFPSLVYQKDFIMKNPSSMKEDNKKSDWNKKVKLYKFNWDNIDFKKEEQHKKWNKEQWPNLKIPYIDTLPEELDKEVKNYVFALDQGYLNEIRRCSQQGLQEWNIPKPFDSITKEICLAIPQSYIKTAFYLLSDCIFNEKTNYWSRDDKKNILCLMLYKFWCHQVDRGRLTIRGFSDWDNQYIREKKWTVEGGETRNRAEKINKLLLKHKKQLDEAMEKYMRMQNMIANEKKY